MIRYILMLIMALGLVPAAAAQQSVGDWNVYTRYGSTAQAVVPTPDRVYFLSSNRLFSYDPEWNETYAYTTRNKLNDTNVTAIAYNPSGRYLLVAYDNGNLDFLYDDGKVRNMSDIKNATLTTAKTINDIDMRDGRIYLATAFGIVVIDDNLKQVKESGIFNRNVANITVVGSLLFIQDKDLGLMYSPLDSHHNTLSKFTTWTSMNTDFLCGIGNNGLLVNTAGTDLLTHRLINIVDGKPVMESYKELTVKADKRPTALKDGTMWLPSVDNKAVYLLDAQGDLATAIAVPDPAAGQCLGMWEGPAALWGADGAGLAAYDISAQDGTATVKVNKIKPASLATEEVFFMKFDSRNRLWTGNLGPTQFRGGYKGDYPWHAQRTGRIYGDLIEDVSLYNASADVYESQAEQRKSKNTDMYGGPTRFVVDPVNPNRYYQGNGLEGIYVIEDGVEVAKFSGAAGNMPVNTWWGTRIMDVNMDREGNLWAGYWTLSDQYTPYLVLPAAKLRGDLGAITPDDWRPSKHLGLDKGDKDMGSVICSRANTIFTWNGGYKSNLGVTLTNGTPANTSDDTYFRLTLPVDQDGKTFEPTTWACGVEDKKGRVWFGTSSGVIEITDPSSMTPQSRITRIKVPRNDGTNFADYLCETDLVYDIAVDPSNRKWIATQASGVYLVSENGDKILEHFTTENSPLPSNCVLSVACDPTGNKVYFGLLTGLVSYTSSSSPGAEDLSDVYAYPNPVRPDYTGLITVTGLMDKSLVKITDSMGSVVFQTRSEGGMVIWDGCDAGGDRVRSGVYYVFASNNGDGSMTSSNKGAVTKIVIVN